jgi:hypothetical protein
MLWSVWSVWSGVECGVVCRNPYRCSLAHRAAEGREVPTLDIA